MISIIVALGQNNLIGNNNELPWNYPADLHYFKVTTTGHKVVMGRNTFESILNRLHKPLPNRENYVVTKNPLWHYPGVQVILDLEKFLKEDHQDEIFVIGGRSIFETALPYANRLYITHIRKAYPGNVFFPDLDLSQFSLVKQKDQNEISFCVYERIKP
ncbi:MAG TPA: dihydrofolate reductase [Acholeplasmatales bacterium]|nr:dihydrofolate reductase [Acholeplasmatales bacterium]